MDYPFLRFAHGETVEVLRWLIGRELFAETQ